MSESEDSTGSTTTVSASSELLVVEKYKTQF